MLAAAEGADIFLVIFHTNIQGTSTSISTNPTMSAKTCPMLSHYAALCVKAAFHIRYEPGVPAFDFHCVFLAGEPELLLHRPAPQEHQTTRLDL